MSQKSTSIKLVKPEKTEKPVKPIKRRRKSVQYDNWGYFFIAPFFIVYIIFSLIPLCTTFYYSFFQYYRDGLAEIGPNWVGIKNFITIFNSSDNLGMYFLNTLIMWIMGFIPQIVVSLVLAVWFTNTELKLKCQQFFKTVIYMPNLIMASAFAMLFFALFSDKGPINNILASIINKANIPDGAKMVESLTEQLKAYALANASDSSLNNAIQAVVNSLGDPSEVFKNLDLEKTNQAITTLKYNAIDIFRQNYSGVDSLKVCGWISEALQKGPDPWRGIRYFSSTGWTRVIVALMNFLMWYGNTTILLMAGVMGIDNSLFEAARIDGANPIQIFFKITIPLLLPIFVYVLITSLIGGIQMFDVPQILTKGNGSPNRTTMTIIMKLNRHLANKNYGLGGATSVFIFVITAVLSGFVYKSTMSKYTNKR